MSRAERRHLDDAAVFGPIQDLLLGWNREVRRALPWRETRDPWAILVSETMLQQTQVDRVRDRYTDFLEAFPTATVCAQAPTAEVVRAWSGLGYNRRALNLQRAAQQIVADHSGHVPKELPDLLALPGVGAYTARAVLAFAFERDHGVVDTNSGRWIARAIAGAPLDGKSAQRIADSLVPAGRSWEWNQAVLDIGAMVCTKRRPDCGDCPVCLQCRWARTEFSEPDPADGSAGVSRPQSRFAGSDRQGRGRIVQALRTGPIEVGRLPDVAGWCDEPERAQRVADSLVSEGLAEYVDGQMTLPS